VVLSVSVSVSADFWSHFPNFLASPHFQLKIFRKEIITTFLFIISFCGYVSSVRILA
jgi:hypothetical protein